MRGTDKDRSTSLSGEATNKAPTACSHPWASPPPQRRARPDDGQPQRQPRHVDGPHIPAGRGDLPTDSTRDDYRQRGRLQPPEAISAATSTYRIRNDQIIAWPAVTDDRSRPDCIDEAVQQVQQDYIDLNDSSLREMHGPALAALVNQYHYQRFWKRIRWCTCQRVVRTWFSLYPWFLPTSVQPP